LGFCLNHVEQSFDQLFGLEGEPEDFTEFSTDALLRSAQKDRVETLVRGVQGGVYSPNEARNQEGLDSVPFGDEPRVQAQVVGLSAAGAIPAAPAAPAALAAPTAAKAYGADLAALRTRAHRPERRAALNGAAAEPRVIRKTKQTRYANDPKNMHDRLAFRFGRQAGIRSTSDTVDQLQAQIENLKEQIKFNAAEYERQIAILMRDLTRAEYKLAQRELIDTFASAPSLSTMKH
jgi:hypothetical protein